MISSAAANFIRNPRRIGFFDLIGDAVTLPPSPVNGCQGLSDSLLLLKRTYIRAEVCQFGSAGREAVQQMGEGCVLNDGRVAMLKSQSHEGVARQIDETDIVDEGSF